MTIKTKTSFVTASICTIGRKRWAMPGWIEIDETVNLEDIKIEKIRANGDKH